MLFLYCISYLVNKIVIIIIIIIISGTGSRELSGTCMLQVVTVRQFNVLVVADVRVGVCRESFNRRTAGSWFG